MISRTPEAIGQRLMYQTTARAPVPGHDRQPHAEQDRQDAGEDQGPLALDLAAEPDGGHDLEDAGRDRPAGDHVEQRQGGEARGQGDGRDSRRDPDQSFQKHRPPGRAPSVRPEHRRGHCRVRSTKA